MGQRRTAVCHQSVFGWNAWVATVATVIEQQHGYPIAGEGVRKRRAERPVSSIAVEHDYREPRRFRSRCHEPPPETEPVRCRQCDGCHVRQADGVRRKTDPKGNYMSPRCCVQTRSRTTSTRARKPSSVPMMRGKSGALSALGAQGARARCSACAWCWRSVCSRCARVQTSHPVHSAHFRAPAPRAPSAPRAPGAPVLTFPAIEAKLRRSATALGNEGLRPMGGTRSGCKTS